MVYDRNYLSMLDDEELIARAAMFPDNSLALVLAERLEAAFDPESGMTAKEMAASLKEIDKMQDEIDGLKSDAIGYENEINGLNSDITDLETKVSDLEEQLREKERAAA